MEPLDVAIQLSDLYEATGTEGSEVAKLIDSEVLPDIGRLLAEADGIGLGQRFVKVLAQIRAIVQGGDETRALKEMMKKVLANYINRTRDILTGRSIFHNAIMKGRDAMLTVTAAGLLSNALAAQHPQQAITLMQSIDKRLTGAQSMAENSSGGAVGSGSIATIAIDKSLIKRKPRKQSIFTDGLSWDDLLDKPTTVPILRQISEGTCNRMVDGVIIDPGTAEMVLATHMALSPDRQKRYETKHVSEMVRIAEKLFKSGVIELVMEEG